MKRSTLYRACDLALRLTPGVCPGGATGEPTKGSEERRGIYRRTVAMINRIMDRREAGR